MNALARRIRFACLLVIGLLAFVPPEAEPQPQATQSTYTVKTELGIRIPMRDGVRLVANIFRPDAEGKFPVIVVRTPYGKSSSGQFRDARWFAEHGYVYLIEDCRGRHDSEGVFRPLRDEARDGYDTIEWAAAQPWSDGNVGTMGGSYLGWNQWLAATLRPPHLKAMIPLVSPPDPFFNMPYQYGAISPMDLDWVSLTSDHDNQNTGELDLDRIYLHLPLIDMDTAASRPSTTWREWVEHSTWDDYWKEVSYEMHYDKIDLPALHISGWYDDDQAGTVRNFTAMRRLGRANQKLLIGPWPHAVNSTTRLVFSILAPPRRLTCAG